MTEDTERQMGNIIDQLDAAESALADSYLATVGEQPEWSNNFGYRDAVAAIEESLAELKGKLLAAYERILAQADLLEKLAERKEES